LSLGLARIIYLGLVKIILEFVHFSIGS
jgi:hypothetical protein